LISNFTIDPVLCDDNLSNHELKQQSDEMMRHFNGLFFEFANHFVNSTQDFSKKIKTTLKQYIRSGTIYTNASPNNHEPQMIDVMENKTDIVDAMLSYCSFFNFDLLDNVIKFLQYEVGMVKMEEYKRRFQKYLKGRIACMPSGVGVKGQQLTKLMFKLDESFKNCRMEFVLQLKKDACVILMINPDHVAVEGIENGSIAIIYHIDKLLKYTIFPLSTVQVDALKRLRYEGSTILELVCDEYYYVLQHFQGCKFFFKIEYLYDAEY